MNDWSDTVIKKNPRNAFQIRSFGPIDLSCNLRFYTLKSKSTELPLDVLELS